MPKQNRPLIRDGRLQTNKKRTDRSYLRPEPPAPDRGAPGAAEADATEENAAAERPQVAPPVAPSAPAAASASAPAVVALASSKLPTAVRAIQQQGVRKRREFDIQALARRDTSYALHELRRIAILATMVVVTLIVLGIVLR